MRLRSFFELVLSINKDDEAGDREDPSLSLPLLRNLAVLSIALKGEPGLLGRKINRHYYRLCRVQEELGRLDFNKAPGSASSASASMTDLSRVSESFEDFVFSQTDFSRYRTMEEKYFERLFPEGLTDFEESFFKKNYGLGRMEIREIIEGSYKKENGLYKLQRENSLILSIMRALDTSLENSKLFSMEEIQEELDKLSLIIKDGGDGAPDIPAAEELYPLLVLDLDGLTISHDDGMKTKLFIRAVDKGALEDTGAPGDTGSGLELAATFMPGNKAWTRVLI